MLRHFGFVKLQNLDAIEVIRHVAPEVLLLLVSSSVLLLVQKHKKLFEEEEKKKQAEENDISDELNEEDIEFEEAEREERMKKIAPLVVIFVQIWVSSLRPSILTAPHFLIFVASSTLWAYGKPFGQPYGWICRILMVYSEVQCIFLIAYQMQFSQMLMPPDGLPARILGFEAYHLSNCSQIADPRYVNWNPSLPTTSWLVPLVLYFLYLVTQFSSMAFLPRQEKEDDENKGKNNEQGNINSSENDAVLGENRNGESESDFDDEITDSQEEEDVGLMGQLIGPLMSMIKFVIRSSYVGTTLMMMLWSITYHSWLTFILLMSTCYLWLNKNQRDATLKASPYLVAYGLVLLVLEWIWCLNLLPTELPQLTQIGLIKHNQLPLPHLLSKIFFVTVLWLTMKMYLDEKRSEVEKMQRSLVASALDPKLLTLKRIESGQNIAEMVQPPSMSHASENILEANPFLGKFLDFVKRWIVKVWIWIVVGMLFVIGTGDVVLYRILYMAIFLIFTVTFILSYHAWRRLLYRFWIAVIVYSMVILVLVYIYQFENFPQIIEEKLSIPIQLQKDFGLEVYSPVELLGSLLTPSFFLIITIIQVYYFHDEFLMLSEIDTRSTVAANFSMAFGNIFQMGSSHLLINDDELSSEDSNLEKEDVSTKLGQEKPTLLEFFTFEELKELALEQSKILFSRIST
ncbi:hypothetical protein QYM36_002255, partial [Artemia franciscana]